MNGTDDPLLALARAEAEIATLGERGAALRDELAALRASPERATPRDAWWRAGAALGASMVALPWLLVIGFYSMVFWDHDVELSGQLAIEGGPDHGWVLRPARCLPGHERGHEGVDLIDPRQPEVSLQLGHPPGYFPTDLVLRRPTTGPVHLTVDDCRQLTGVIEHDPDYDETTVWRGRVEIDCDLPDGGRLHGALSVSGC